MKWPYKNRIGLSILSAAYIISFSLPANSSILEKGPLHLFPEWKKGPTVSGQLAYMKTHKLIFSRIDKTGSSVEEILSHDGFHNASKLTKYWRNVLTENAKWPDRKSTTDFGPRPAMEHGLLKNGNGWGFALGADKKVDEYFRKALWAWNWSKAANDPSQKEAWAWIGRASHFLQDMSLPSHTEPLFNLTQLFHHDPFEICSDEHFDEFMPSKNNDAGMWNGEGPYPKDKQWGIYFNSQTPGQIVKATANEMRKKYSYMDNFDDISNGHWNRLKAYAIPLATKQCAGLVVAFLRAVGEKP